jgi:DNA-binding winged helix-turn-helix (wHTH) protein
MGAVNFKMVFFFLLPLMVFARTSAGVDNAEKHILVSMRMIGHTILLHAGDSASRVLPVEKVEGRYKIRFASDFQFDPEKLVTIIDSIVKSTGIASRFITEVEKCETGEVIYSFEIGDQAHTDVLPCKTRMPEKGCYTILITLLDPVKPEPDEELVAGNTKVNYSFPAGLISIILALTGLILYSRKKTQTTTEKSIDSNLIAIGGYRFDRNKSELLVADQRVELSAKESDLLHLLYRFANTTVEREELLRNIWGDEGDYVGRTLDVFISRLRKKLELDTSVQIVNIRGVGYKLVVEERG